MTNNRSALAETRASIQECAPISEKAVRTSHMTMAPRHVNSHARPSNAHRVLRRFSAELLEAELMAWKSANPKRRIHMVAGSVGVDMRTLTNWRTGRTTPDANELFALEFALDVTGDRLSAPVATRP